jgi:hypothetical protein
MKWIITDDQAFNIVENEFFQIMIKRLRPEVKFISADTVTNDLSKLFKHEQILIQRKLQNTPSKISFTFDGWTSTNQMSFLGVTAHWISENWDLKQITLDFHHLEGPHSGENLSKALINILKNYGILTKVNIFFIN